MKKWIVFTLVALLLAVTVVPVFAAGNSSAGPGYRFGGRGVFALSGTIDSIDPDAKTVTVMVVCGNTLVKPYYGQTLTLQTDENTRFLLRNPGGTAIPITFDDLEVGQKVSANGLKTGQDWKAVRITVGAELLCLP